MFYKVVIQYVILYGSETWDLSSTMWSKLRSFHHGVTRSLSSKKYRVCEETGKIMYSSITEIMIELDLEEIEVYIKRRKDTLLKTLSGEDYNIYMINKCVEMETKRRREWWSQD